MRIAILDDYVSQTDFVSQTLTTAGHTCHAFNSGKEMLARLRRETFDMLLLDWNVPDKGGDEILVWVRQNLSVTLPVIFMTNRTSEEDIVSGLNLGADDYMIKPVRKFELLARVEALLRRTYAASTTGRDVYGAYTFDHQTHTVHFNGLSEQLTQKEFDLAQLFFRNLSRPLSRSHILETVWGRDIDVPSRTMDTHVSRIRTKLDLRTENGFRLSPVYSYGYRLEKLAEDEA